LLKAKAATFSIVDFSRVDRFSRPIDFIGDGPGRPGGLRTRSSSAEPTAQASQRESSEKTAPPPKGNTWALTPAAGSRGRARSSYLPSPLVIP